jgi:hypothetical protein
MTFKERTLISLCLSGEQVNIDYREGGEVENVGDTLIFEKINLDGSCTFRCAKNKHLIFSAKDVEFLHIIDDDNISIMVRRWR